MKFDTFVIGLGYIRLFSLAIVIVLMLIIMVMAPQGSAMKEGFSVARLYVHEGLPGPVWWYYPMHQLRWQCYNL